MPCWEDETPWLLLEPREMRSLTEESLMGLDNLPRTYPCSKAGTAVLDADKRIDCELTAAQGGCPWQNNAARPAAELILGMFGTSCWVRGKYYNHVLQLLGLDEDLDTFYGDEEDGTYKTPQSCRELAEAIRAANAASTERDIMLRLADLEGAVDDIDAAVRQVREQAAYAAWWLDWVADNGDGATCWY